MLKECQFSLVLSMTRLRDWGLLLICNLIWVSQFVLVKIVQDQAGDKLYLAVVNRNESAEVVSSIRVSGWSAGRAAEAARKHRPPGAKPGDQRAVVRLSLPTPTR